MIRLLETRYKNSGIPINMTISMSLILNVKEFLKVRGPCVIATV